MEHLPRVMIIPILLLNNKKKMSLCHKDQTLWPEYITIGNLIQSLNIVKRDLILCFWALFQLFMSNWKMKIIKIEI